ncbi:MULTISPECIES: hypothetical protein [Okeania]|uniref:hypothetical protein n=1 Tax=Okeania TaxID=1458928 RepID=UPI001374E9DC|nr:MULTISPECIES: hypothetical protein [Okeania]NET11942.1 hypothetical protein [Okeania sp. SIO1H6]NES76211.1 hypothetical protein [Okeania sp. SIO1H4]NES89190.1 hypothetical protein [Okeania sp. SIO2B9]NET19653.1 hypothetical protein [Okeania sp. SIO1H5]NET74669.1 hypothetical protein [Okeania sp. SIO1F9]
MTIIPDEVAVKYSLDQDRIELILILYTIAVAIADDRSKKYAVYENMELLQLLIIEDIC